MADHPVLDLASRLRASPAELLGLVVLLTGVVAVTVAIWWTGLARPLDATTDDVGSAAPGSAAGSAAPVGQVTVHVGGAVAAPGVVTLPDGSRVADAVAAAGGVTADADPGGLNLARVLQDGEQVLVPVVGAAGGLAAGDAAAEGAITSDGRVDLNRATVAELETLPGVGPVLAARIAAWRDEHGPFTEPGQLREVSGIGERTFQAMVDAVLVR